MIRIGLIGEDPNDTKAIQHLLRQKFDAGFLYKTLSKNQTGSKMFNDSAVRSYNIELRTSSYSCIIVVQDADAIKTETDKIKIKQDKYQRLEKQLNCNCLLLLNIYELEALILADINGLNKYYNTSVVFKSSVSHKAKPKEFLEQKTEDKYKVSHCPDIFQQLNIDTIAANCDYFKLFISKFEQAIGN